MFIIISRRKYLQNQTLTGFCGSPMVAETGESTFELDFCMLMRRRFRCLIQRFGGGNNSTKILPFRQLPCPYLIQHCKKKRPTTNTPEILLYFLVTMVVSVGPSTCGRVVSLNGFSTFDRHQRLGHSRPCPGTHENLVQFESPWHLSTSLPYVLNGRFPFRRPFLLTTFLVLTESLRHALAHDANNWDHVKITSSFLFQKASSLP